MADKQGKLHPRIADEKPFEGSGRDVTAPKAPIVSVAPMSTNPSDNKNDDDNEPVIYDDFAGEDAFLSNASQVGNEFGLDDLETGSATFIKPNPGETVDKLMIRVHKSLALLRTKYSVSDTDDKGDEILDQVCVQTKKRNDDGTVQLSEDKPIVGANFQQIPRRIYFRNYIAMPVTKDQELGDDAIPADGVLIMRSF